LKTLPEPGEAICISSEDVILSAAAFPAERRISRAERPRASINLGSLDRLNGSGLRDKAFRVVSQGYSARKVFAGSICAARHAGKPQAINDTPVNSTMTPK
jgi:hypothetical protein